jgi:hypothetical protein
VATDSQDRVYVFQRKDPPVMVFDRQSNYLNCWGIGAITDPHGMTIVDDIVYITDRSDSVAVTFTLDGKPLQVIGRRLGAQHGVTTRGPRSPSGGLGRRGGAGGEKGLYFS